MHRVLHKNTIRDFLFRAKLPMTEDDQLEPEGSLLEADRRRRTNPQTVNARLIFCIALGVFTAHMGVVMLLSHLHPQPKVTPRPKDNFSLRSAGYTDSATGDKMVYREFTVSTKFAPADSTPVPAKPRIEAPVTVVSGSRE